MSALLPCPNPCDRAEIIIQRMQRGLGMPVGHTLTQADYDGLKAHLRIALDTEVEAGGPYLNDGWNRRTPPPETPTSGPDCDGEAGQCAMSAREDKSPLRIVSGVEEALKALSDILLDYGVNHTSKWARDRAVAGLSGITSEVLQALSPPALVEGDQGLSVSRDHPCADVQTRSPLASETSGKDA